MADMRDHIIREIRRLTAANGGKAPGVLLFQSETGIGESSWRGVYWARWGDAVAEAGYAPNTFNRKMDSDKVFAQLATAVRHFGKIPTDSELKLYGRNRSSFPHGNTIRSHFNTKANMIARLREWTVSRPEFADVTAMLPIQESAPPEFKRSKVNEGIVYLIQSGAHYKIGRSDELERRIKEIRIALPDAATLIHSIVTDDPAGIEAYWHRRFADRRANGEWFKLSSGDVAAFKRRKFQ
jgi:hypothetical protein